MADISEETRKGLTQLLFGNAEMSMTLAEAASPEGRKVLQAFGAAVRGSATIEPPQAAAEQETKPAADERLAAILRGEPRARTVPQAGATQSSAPESSEPESGLTDEERALLANHPELRSVFLREFGEYRHSLEQADEKQAQQAASAAREDARTQLKAAARRIVEHDRKMGT